MYRVQFRSQPLKHQELINVLHTMVEQHDNLVSGYHLASVHNKLDNVVKVLLARRNMPWINVSCFQSTEKQFNWRRIITIFDKRS